jgi:hypothetical protein
MGKSTINTPMGSMEGTVAPVPGEKGKHSAEYDHNRAPFNKPHSMGKDTIPTKFFEGSANNIGNLTPDPEAFETPFGNTLATRGSVNRHNRKSGN